MDNIGLQSPHPDNADDRDLPLAIKSDWADGVFCRTASLKAQSAHGFVQICPTAWRMGFRPSECPLQVAIRCTSSDDLSRTQRNYLREFNEFLDFGTKRRSVVAHPRPWTNGPLPQIADVHQFVLLDRALDSIVFASSEALGGQIAVNFEDLVASLPRESQ